ncbi:DUF3795 domain-containing protein [Vibrio parahaemolyticus]|uniref:DUF3795 domain-containing protein n=1 Tax=Vibrio parahaemolyticus TaxID=670 RepID=UPI00226A8DBB|nr:DUF3795 domain-containing protein [Vibrio parahaemolyticus]MCX8905811.1 DUF3795 domain-containing protein [Vibrio parahaemolyticus]
MYKGIIPPCGIYCGECPRFKRSSLPCKGAEFDCRQCKGIYHCCVELKGLSYCYQCDTFPCYKFTQFAKRWAPLGQDLIANQKAIEQHGCDELRKLYKSNT